MAADSADDLRAISSYRAADIGNGCMIEAIVFTHWMREQWPRYPVKIVRFPYRAPGWHATVAVVVNGSVRLWDYELGMMKLGDDIAALDDPHLMERARTAYLRALQVRARARHGGDNLVPLAESGRRRCEAIYRRIAGVVPAAALIRYQGVEFVGFIYDEVLHLFSEDVGAARMPIATVGDVGSALREMLIAFRGGGGRFDIAAGGL